MRTKTLVIVALAFAAGGTCPSDVNNDGTVGINDFLQVLAAWGPCPNASVVDFQTLDLEGKLAARLWSDNTLEISARQDLSEGSWGCEESIPRAGEWSVFESPPSRSGAHPVTLKTTGIGQLNIAYSDGSAYQRQYTIALGIAGCNNPGHPGLTEHHEFSFLTEWIPFTGVPR